MLRVVSKLNCWRKYARNCPSPSWIVMISRNKINCSFTKTPCGSYMSPRLASNSQKSSFAKSFSFPSPVAVSSIRIRHFFTNSSLSASQTESRCRTCWKCGGNTSPERELFFCACGVIQKPAKDLTYYDLLQVKQGFDIDVKELSQCFKNMQRLLHPDKFSTKSKEEQDFAEEQSSLLNIANDTLLKPLNRAIYLLELDNVTISENDSVTDPEFLMNMMDDFESIDSASSPEDVESLEKRNDSRIGKCIEKLSKVFLQSDLVNAKNLTIELRYFTTIQDRIKELRLKSFGP